MHVEFTNRFKRDFRRESKGRHKDFLEAELTLVISRLCAAEPLEPRHFDHALTGNWRDFRDCHLRPDLILIYRIIEDSVQLVRLGSHSTLGL